MRRWWALRWSFRRLETALFWAGDLCVRAVLLLMFFGWVPWLIIHGPAR